MNLPIETEDLGKRYGNVTAVKHLSLRVAEGEIYAFLGLNGAGKTATIRMLLGMIRPTWGTAQVIQTRVRLGSRKPWASVGYLVETPHSYQELTVYENLEVARRLHPGTAPKAVGHIIERMGLAAYADRRAGTLSQGNAQRLGLAKALLHAPRLLLLDEPANGLDPAGIVEIRELLLELTREQGHPRTDGFAKFNPDDIAQVSHGAALHSCPPAEGNTAPGPLLPPAPGLAARPPAPAGWR